LILFRFGNSQTDISIASKPLELNDGIKTATLSEAGMDPAVINELSAQISSNEFPNIHSLLIYKNNKLVFEKYFPGKDQIWGKELGVIEHSIDDIHDVRSISKSIVSACIGIAIAQGKIKSVDQKIFEFFNDYAALNTGMKMQLTIKHLLTMSSGLEWNEDVPYDNPENSEIQMSYSDDPIKFVLSRPLVAEPGKEWNYNGGTTELLSIILERATGKKVDQFAGEYLFKPLGIENFEWTKFPGMDQPAAASGLRLRSRDLLKFGILYLNKGNWYSKQIIPEDWVIQSFQTSIARPKSGGYGYQFWIQNDTINEHPINLVIAVGNGDQRIYFDEANNLLVITTAGNYNLWDIKNNSYELLKKIYDSFDIK
jgi:CubicO group peptidase (beta-lactamase class C family)